LITCRFNIIVYAISANYESLEQEKQLSH